ncbi:unnamed protein product, partial [Iphiclides podalirius]
MALTMVPETSTKWPPLTSLRKRLRFEFGTVERAMAEHPAPEDATMSAEAKHRYTMAQFYSESLVTPSVIIGFFYALPPKRPLPPATCSVTGGSGCGRNLQYLTVMSTD